MKYLLYITLAIFLQSCQPGERSNLDVPDYADGVFLWENANIYFLLTDRFNNGDPANDFQFSRKKDGAVLRNFEGGDIAGITAKIREGYFNDLGVNAIWFTPPVEQVHGHTDEGTGKTYGYHGYWTKDWTSLDPNFGTWEELGELVSTAHQHGIRVVLDVVLNHTGPVTEIDKVWPADWVRTSPKCLFQDARTTVTCTLVENLPDIRTETEKDVKLPPFLIAKWKAEGRYEKEVAELEAFFDATGLPRSPRHYIMKWLVDFIKKLGIDAFRVDTAKHTEPKVWSELYTVAAQAFEKWKEENEEEKLDGHPFYMFGEVYNYAIHHGQTFDMGKGDSVNFYDYDFGALINFDLKSSADRSLEEVYSVYSDILHGGELTGLSTISYISSHDDGSPFDIDRRSPKEAGTRLLLTPGACQIYYGDETARPLVINGARGDANLRSAMNWADIVKDEEIAETLAHWQRLGQFRNAHPAVGAGIHKMISEQPYVFRRSFQSGNVNDEVIVAIEHSDQSLEVSDSFAEGTELLDYYSGKKSVVKNGKVHFKTGMDLLLIGQEN